MSEKNEKKPNEQVNKEQPQENRKEKDSDLQALVSRLKSENEELQKKVLSYQKQFEDADKEKDSWKNKYYEAYADRANTRKQIEKENEDFKKYAQKSLIEELIPTLDSFDRSLRAEPKDEATKRYKEGFQRIHNKLLNSLKQAHVEIIAPKVGEEYDPHTRMALSTIEGEENNKVAEVYRKGYKLYDHLLRAASVVTTVKTEKKEEKKDEKNDDTIEVK